MNKETRRKLAQMLRSARTEQRMSQDELARRAGRTPKTISDMELGKTTPDQETLIKIAEVLGVSLEDFDRMREFWTDDVRNYADVVGMTLMRIPERWRREVGDKVINYLVMLQLDPSAQPPEPPEPPPPEIPPLRLVPKQESNNHDETDGAPV